jgi:nitrite reductase (NADH) small subunit
MYDTAGAGEPVSGSGSPATAHATALTWIRLAPSSALTVGEAVQVDVDGDLVALFHTLDGMHAVSGFCLHAGGPLAEGEVSAGVVTCPWHSWRYDLRTGQRIDRPGGRLATYPVRVSDGSIWLALPGRKGNPQ